MPSEKKPIIPFFILIIITSFFFFFTTSTFAAIQTYTGIINQIDDQGTGIYAKIPITIASDSEVSLWFGATCDNQNNLEFRFNTTTNPNGDDFYGNTIYGTETTDQPLGYYPLKAGQYIAMVFCRNQKLPPPPNENEPNNDILYTVEVESVPLVTPYTVEDQEPDPTYERNITSSATFSGWLGLTGNPGAGFVNPMGQDSSDMYMVNIDKGTDIQFKLEYDNFRSTNGGRDLGFKLRLYRWKNDKTYFVDEFDPIQHSGQLTKQIKLVESGTYKLYVAFYSTLSEAPTDNRKYGGYKLTIMVNGEQVPDVRIGGVRKISTRYWNDDTREYITREDLVAGKNSNVDILIANYGSQSVPVTLKYGLSVNKGPITMMGSTKLNIAPTGGSYTVYNTSLLTPTNTPHALKGNLVVILYGSSLEVLDTFQTEVGLYSDRKAVAVFILGLLLNNNNPLN